MDGKPLIRRRQLIVSPELQRKIVKDVVRVPLIAFGICVVVLGVLVGRLRIEAAVADVYLPSLVPCIAAICGLIVIATFALLSQAARVSNKVAGPQFNIRRVVQQALAEPSASEASSRRVRLRSDDYLHEVAEDVNALLSRLQESATATETPTANEPQPVGGSGVNA